MKVDLNKNSLAMWVVCEAIKDDSHLAEKFDYSREGIHEIKMTIDGVDVNFMNVINRIDEIYDDMVKKAAGKMYLEQYDRRSDEITEELTRISERLQEIRRTKFPEIDWADD